MSPPDADLKRTGRVALLDAYQPFLEADLGGGRLLLLSQKQCVWRPGAKGKPVVFELSKLRSVVLSKSWVWESLIFAVGFGAAFWITSGWPWRLAMAGLSAMGVVASLAERKCTLSFELKAGGRSPVLLGIGTPRSAVMRRIDSVWSSLSEELERLGVPTSRSAR